MDHPSVRHQQWPAESQPLGFDSQLMNRTCTKDNAGRKRKCRKLIGHVSPTPRRARSTPRTGKYIVVDVLIQGNPNGFDLRVRLQRVRSHFPAEAALLVTAEG